ncbi:MAG: hypothetical protein ACKVPX_07725 [Myxococcaceae bacterium]
MNTMRETTGLGSSNPLLPSAHGGAGSVHRFAATALRQYQHLLAQLPEVRALSRRTMAFLSAAAMVGSTVVGEAQGLASWVTSATNLPAEQTDRFDSNSAPLLPLSSPAYPPGIGEQRGVTGVPPQPRERLTTLRVRESPVMQLTRPFSVDPVRVFDADGYPNEPVLIREGNTVVGKLVKKAPRFDAAELGKHPRHLLRDVAPYGAPVRAFGVFDIVNGVETALFDVEIYEAGNQLMARPLPLDAPTDPTAPVRSRGVGFHGLVWLVPGNSPGKAYIYFNASKRQREELSAQYVSGEVPLSGTATFREDIFTFPDERQKRDKTGTVLVGKNGALTVEGRTPRAVSPAEAAALMVLRNAQTKLPAMGNRKPPLY